MLFEKDYLNKISQNSSRMMISQIPFSLTTGLGTTGQNNKALAYRDGVLGIGSANGKFERSLDKGLTWSADISAAVFGSSQITCFKWSPVVAGLCAAVTDTGVIAISTDYAASFTALANDHGGTPMSNCEFDENGILHVCGELGKYSHSTTSACTAMTSLIDVDFGSVTCDCLYAGPGFLMISGHSNKLNRSVDGGVTWTGLITTGFDSTDSLWNVIGDGANTVIIAVYDSSTGNKGKYRISTDSGVTFGAAISTFYTTDSIRIVRIKYFSSRKMWVFCGDSAYFGYTLDINVAPLRTVYHVMSTGIVFNAADLGNCIVVSGATGRVGKSISINEV